jgi:hypothetical protein
MENYKEAIKQLIEQVNSEKYLRYIYILLTEMVSENRINKE